jgi:hypothetical protein
MGRVARALGIATGALVLSAFLQTQSVAADALYGASSAGTWDFNQACDNQPFSRTYSLWYIVNASQTYPFDIPNPHFVPGEHVTVKLAPTVVGRLGGTVGLTGADTIDGQLPMAAPWQGELAAATFTLSYQPGQETVGSLAVPAEWAAQYVGFAALTAVITGDQGTATTIVMLAQPFNACGASPPPTDTEAMVAPPASDGRFAWGVILAAGAAVAAWITWRRTGSERVS